MALQQTKQINNHKKSVATTTLIMVLHHLQNQGLVLMHVVQIVHYDKTGKMKACHRRENKMNVIHKAHKQNSCNEYTVYACYTEMLDYTVLS